MSPVDAPTIDQAASTLADIDQHSHRLCQVLRPEGIGLPVFRRLQATAFLPLDFSMVGIAGRDEPASLMDVVSSGSPSIRTKKPP
jgi:hypothetical protein